MADQMQAESRSVLDKANNWARQSLGLKLVVVSSMVLLLLIPAAMVRGLINERQGRHDGVVSEISSLWGGSQVVWGPVLNLPYFEPVKGDSGKVTYCRRALQVLPDQLHATGGLFPEVRHRGIYQAVLYNAQLRLGGSFTVPEVQSLGIDPAWVQWGEATVCLGVSDMRGIRDSIVIQWGGKDVVAEPGVNLPGIADAKIGAKVPIAAGGGAHPFALQLNLNGSDCLNFAPLGRTTTVELTSTWPDPSFGGAFLPQTKQVTKQGFSAQWKVLHFNRNIPQHWIGTSYDVSESLFGVSLAMPASQYQQTERSAKYALLFIGLTFLAFFLMEVLLHKRVHPVQYLLVGFGLSIFYTLLLALTEHTSFGLAYLVAGAAVVALVSLYVHASLRSTPLTLLTAAILAGLYGFLYVVLRAEDYSLLMGSVGLFAILAAVMYVTRKVDWYSIGGQRK